MASLWTKAGDLRARPSVEKVNMLASPQQSFKRDLGVPRNLLGLYGNTGAGPAPAFNFSSHSIRSFMNILKILRRKKSLHMKEMTVL